MVFLFDIDGTLLNGNGVGRRSIDAALRDLYGRSFDFSDIPFSGKTDPLIFGEILRAAPEHGLDAEDTPEQRHALTSRYEEEMHRVLPDAAVDVLDGGRELVHRFAADGTPVGLLTGNLRSMAAAKVERIDLPMSLFPFGAYGSDAEDRDHLPPVAAERAAAHLGREVPHETLVIVGDTPRDVQCAHAVGARCVAVTTGHFDADALHDAGADAVLDSLDDWDSVGWLTA